MTMSDTETMTDRANREAIAAGEAAIDRLTALYNAADCWDFDPEDTGTSAERFKLFDDAEGSQILDGVLRPCASVADEAAAAIGLLIAALTAMQRRR
jgi:oligoribonuclease NrnB/cAMP/cGMP phosphodiesterase (DHH superfamily)